MKKLLFIILTILSTSVYAEWDMVLRNSNGSVYYVDFDRIKKHDGFIYYWWLTDLLKPDKDGDLSYKSYNQADCSIFRFKQLSGSYHKTQMGVGRGQVFKFPDEWHYPAPGSYNEAILNEVCLRSK